jgi:hypothetical protein
VLKSEIALGFLLATAIWTVIGLFFTPSHLEALKDFAGPTATVFAATVAGWVAYRLGKAQVDVAERNWRTSNEKIVLELFEKRLAIFEEIRDVIGEVVRSGQAKQEVQFRYVKAIDRVAYFFGDEVNDYLNGLYKDLLHLDSANYMINQVGMSAKRMQHFAAISDFYKLAPSLFRPYMRAHQRAD